MRQRRENRIIDWNYPEPKSRTEKFIGPGATKAELIIQQAFPYLFGTLLPLIAYLKGWGWNWIQMILAALLAIDMLGGVLTNATSTAKRWYHREGQGFKQHMKFVLLHILQIFVVMAAFDWGNWIFVIGGYSYLLIASLTILKSPLYLQRPIALGSLFGGVLIALYILPTPPHFEWFLPAYYIKILVSHLLLEEPYRPVEE